MYLICTLYIFTGDMRPIGEERDAFHLVPQPGPGLGPGPGHHLPTPFPPSPVIKTCNCILTSVTDANEIEQPINTK